MSSNEALSIHFYMQRNDPLITCSIWAPQSEHMVEKRQRFYSVRKHWGPQLFKHFRDHSLPPSCPIDRTAWIQRSKFTWISCRVHHTENTSLNPDYCSSRSDPESEKQALPSEWGGIFSLACQSHRNQPIVGLCELLDVGEGQVGPLDWNAGVGWHHTTSWNGSCRIFSRKLATSLKLVDFSQKIIKLQVSYGAYIPRSIPFSDSGIPQLFVVLSFSCILN